MGSFSAHRSPWRQSVRLLVAGCLAIGALALPSLAEAAKGDPLQTAFLEHGELDGREADIALARARAAGVTAYRIFLRWYEVAPAERPEGFKAEDPADPAYRWDAFDLKIRRLRAYGMEPIVSVNYPPVWAGGGYLPKPDAVEFGKFARAAAQRYSGSFQGLPRVRYWQIWNEANVLLFFSPQFDEADRPVSPALYRSVLNEAAAAVKAVHADNIVIAGGLSPFGVASGETRTVAPLRFTRDLLCMSAGTPATPTCNEKTYVDIWAVHPYTRGGPTHRAANPEDASIGNLVETKALIDAAAKAGRITTNQKLRIWTTEFSWDTNPPDPKGLPHRLHARWVSEALYRMWNAGVSLVTWLQLRDFPYPEAPTQAGMYFRGGPSIACDPPKPSLLSFRFPFVAFKGRAGISVWGRTPAGRPGQVVLEQLSGKKWKRLAAVRTDRHGIFSRVVRVKSRKGTHVEDQSYTRRYRDLVVCDGASAYWRLGERTGQIAVDAAGTRAGRYEASALGTASALRSDRDAAVTLNGGDGRVALPPLFSPRTVELWIRTGARNVVAFSNRNDVSHGVYLGIDAAGKALVFDTAALVSRKTVADNRWHYVVYTYDGTTGRLYVDGALEASAAWQRLEVGEPASVGFDATLKNRFAGALDELAVYETPLSEAQVKAHFQASSKNLRVRQLTTFSGSYLRARLPSAKVASLPFSLVPVPNRPVDPSASG